MAEQLTWEEWQQKANSQYVKGSYSAQQMLRDWGYPQGMSADTWKIDFDKGKVRRKNRSVRRQNRDVYNTTRAEAEKIPAYVQQLFEQYGQPERYNEFVSWVEEGNRLQKQRTPVGFNVGHIGALSKGKPNVPTNRRLEIASVNQERSDKDEPSDEALLVTGVPRTWQEAVINFLDPTGLPTELTPQDTQRIRGGEDPSLVFEQRADIIKGIRQKLANVNKVVNRFNAVETGLNLLNQGQISSPVHQRVEQFARDVKPVIGGVQITGEPDPETDIGKQVGDMFKQFYQQLDNLAKQKPRYGEVPNLPNLK